MQDFKLYSALLKEVEEDRVRRTTQVIDGVSISLFKYTDPCAFKHLWNDVNRQARGIIFRDDTKEILARPFDKFMNLDEEEATKLENLPKGDFHISEKLDGSCIISYLFNNKILCATPGSLISDQAQWATKWLNEYLKKNDNLDIFEASHQYDKLTFIFEAIYPENLNVVCYPKERNELVLLAVRYLNGIELQPHVVDNLAKIYNFSRPKFYKFDLSRTLAFPANEEGYVVHWPSENNFRVKVKSPEYVRLHRIKSCFNAKGVCEVLAESRWASFIEILPPHLQKEADDIASALRSKYYDLKNTADDLFYAIKDLPTRKEKALAIQKCQNRKIWPIVFSMLDDTPPDTLRRYVWHQIYKDLEGLGKHV